jgi:phosphate butyryltransferase
MSTESSALASAGPIETIDDLIKAALQTGRKRVAVAAAEEASVLSALVEGWKLGLVEPILIGNIARIDELGVELGLELSRFRRIRTDDPEASASEAVGLVRSGEADFLMKGYVDTSVLLTAAFNKLRGINAGALASHVEVLELPSYPKLLFATDCAINIAPDIQAKLAIIRNAVRAAKALGVAAPKVALLAALEKVTERMPATVEAAIIAQMWRRGQIGGCIVDGPLALDNAVSAESARIKGIVSEVAGDADILVAPDIEVGNVLCKALLDLGGAKGAGIVMGAAAPIVMASRSDSARTMLASVAFAALAMK